LLGLSSALFNALDNILISSSKKNYDAISFLNGKLLMMFLIFLPIIFFNGININSNSFWLVLFLAILVDGIGSIGYVEALQISGVTHTVPLLSLTPLFVLLTGLFVNEIPTPMASLAVFLIVIGVYTLNISKNKEGFFEPFLFIFKEKGTLLMFIVAIVFSLNAVLFKLGIEYSDLITTMFLVVVGELVLYSIYNTIKKNHVVSIIKKKPKLLFGSALFVVVGNYALGFGYNYLDVSFMIALKRLTILFSTIFGIIFLKEKNIKEKIIGSIIIVSGVILLALSGG
jgi:drug/metabolite transporter (DMT)-like permease